MTIYHVVDSLRERATYSTALSWEPAIWYPYAFAEIKAKLMSEEQHQQVKRLANKLKRLHKI